MPIQCTCKQCGAMFFVKPSRITTGRGIFCSRACHSDFERFTPERDFWPRVIKDSAPDGCWEWSGYVSKSGYSHCTNRSLNVHRIAWEWANGPIPPGKFVLHQCDNRICVRPDHLFLGTHIENMLDMRMKGRSARGEQVSIAKLTAPAVRDIRAAHADGGVSIRALARQYGVRPKTLAQVIRRETWKHIA